ncbi:unnamed protein product [Closterium sp. NIES-65]|nr:unnamed protein product [Closterium sp. NIES-65]
MAGRSILADVFVPTLLLVAFFSQLVNTRAVPVSLLASQLKSRGTNGTLVERMFGLDGTSEISGVTILLPQPVYAFMSAAANYPYYDNSTRKFSKAIFDALFTMTLAERSSTEWPMARNDPAVVKAMIDIWKFQVIKEYIPPSVATAKYVSGGPWELPTMQGQPLWMSYISTTSSSSPLGMYYSSGSTSASGTWNISGTSPQQHAASPPPPPNPLIPGDYRMIDGSPLAFTEEDAGDLLVDIPESEVAVYMSARVLFPYNMDAIGAYAGKTTASILHMLASVGLALFALLLV